LDFSSLKGGGEPEEAFKDAKNNFSDSRLQDKNKEK